jgi:hypothetical protein
MQVEKFHFDEVFDVVAEDGHFSFRSQGRTHYGVKLQKHVIPRKGSTFAVAFAKPGNWTTVLGWRDLASANVMFARPTSFWWHFALSDIVMYGLLFILGGFLLAGAGGTLVVTVVCACMAFYQMRLNDKVKRALSFAGANGDDGASAFVRHT